MNCPQCDEARKEFIYQVTKIAEALNGDQHDHMLVPALCDIAGGLHDIAEALRETKR